MKLLNHDDWRILQKFQCKFLKLWLAWESAMVRYIPNYKHHRDKHDNYKARYIEVMSRCITDAWRTFCPCDCRLGPVLAKVYVKSNIEELDKVTRPADTDYNETMCHTVSTDYKDLSVLDYL